MLLCYVNPSYDSEMFFSNKNFTKKTFRQNNSFALVLKLKTRYSLFRLTMLCTQKKTQVVYGQFHVVSTMIRSRALGISFQFPWHDLATCSSHPLIGDRSALPAQFISLWRDGEDELLFEVPRSTLGRIPAAAISSSKLNAMWKRGIASFIRLAFAGNRKWNW